MMHEATMMVILRSVWTTVKRAVRALAGDRPLRRVTSMALLYVMVVQPVLNLRLQAETAGATAPEVTKFEPVDTKDLVDLASGDFTYNIPIINVPGSEGGYPLSLNYHAGIRQGEEASWVGLGWNLQPGSISRSIRGYPDDFNGFEIEKDFRSNDYPEYSIGVGFGVGGDSSGLGMGVGITYAQYRGFGGYVSVGPRGMEDSGFGAKLSYSPEGNWSLGVGYTAVSGTGLSVDISSTGAVGVGVNQRLGSGDSMSKIGASLRTDEYGSTSVGYSVEMREGVSITGGSRGNGSVGISTKEHGSATFSSYTGGGWESWTVGVSIPLGVISIDAGYTVSYIDKAEFEYAYGYYYHHLRDASGDRVNEWVMETDPNKDPGDSKEHALDGGFNYLPSYDNYTITGQGTGGGIKPTRLRDWVYRPKPKDSQWYEAQNWPWVDAAGNEVEGDKARFVFIGDNTEIVPMSDRVGLAARGSDERGRLLPQVESESSGQISNPLKADLNSALMPTQQKMDPAAFNTSAAANLFLGKSYRPGGGARIVNPLIDGGRKFSGFDIWEVDGKHYIYGEAISNLWSENVAANKETRTGEWFRSKTFIGSPYAYAWYLTELRYPDYFEDAGTRKGGWVKFFYTVAASDYRWHTSSDGELNDGPVNRVDRVGQKKAGMMYGMEYGAKQIKYPSRVETDTHIAFFMTSPRQDAQEVTYAATSEQTISPTRANGQFYIQKRQDGKIDIILPNGWPASTFTDALGQAWYNWGTYPHGNCQVSQGPSLFSNLGIWINDLHKPLPAPWKLTHAGKSYYPLIIPSVILDFKGNPVAWYSAGTPTWDDGKQVNAQLTIPSGAYGDPDRGAPLNQDPDIYTMDSSTEPGARWINLNGVPILSDSIEVRKQDYIASNFATLNSPSKQRQFVYHHMSCRITIDPQSQFWNDATANAKDPRCFQGIKNVWNNILTTAALNGGQVSFKSQGMQKLDDIYLIEKSTGQLVKQVHFNYDYSLAPGTPNSVVSPDNPTRGKLALKTVQVFGQGGMSSGGGNSLPPYRFFYDLNPGVASKYQYDRWGFFKSDGWKWRHRESNPGDQAAWCLTRLQLPTGGTLQVQYEPKDYTRVQDRPVNNPRANAGAVGNYFVDKGPLKNILKDGNGVSLNKWPETPTEWTSFYASVHSVPLVITPPGGDSAKSIPAVTSTLGSATVLQGMAVPLKAAPDPKDLKKWFNGQSPVYASLKSKALAALGNKTTEATGELMPLEASGTTTLLSTDYAERMVSLVFEYFTSTATGQQYRTMQAPQQELRDSDIALRGDADRRVARRFSVLAIITGNPGTNGARMLVVDPDFRWPKQEPDAIYLQITNRSAKVGGGVRTKRVVSFDGKRSYTTSYTYADFVDGQWMSSGVAAMEPPPYGYSADDDRVIQPEYGGWANEMAGGIYHSRVTVRHGWREGQTPAGVANTETPLGETVFRFITPADLPHRQKSVEELVNYSGSGGVGTNAVRLTEVFNVGAWWGNLLWTESRDSKGRPLVREEKVYTQLDGYLRYFPKSERGQVGQDIDLDYQLQATGDKRRPQRDYWWAVRPGEAGALPVVADGSDAANKGNIGINFPTTAESYLNASVNVTLAHRSKFGLLSWLAGQSGYNQTVDLTRELNLVPMVSQTRTYSEGSLNPTGIQQNKVWEARTAQVLESWTRGRQGSLGDEWLISRSWPAYWAYPDMFQRPADTGWVGAITPQTPVVNMLNQEVQTTTSRLVGAQETYLNSKVQTWWQPRINPDATQQWNAGWFKGAEFVWNGKLAQGVSTPGLFPGFPNGSDPKGWRPDSTGVAQLLSTNFQPFKSSNWLFGGAVTKYDAFGHALEAVDGDGAWTTSLYGYPYTGALTLMTGVYPYQTTAEKTLPTGVFPIAKFGNARWSEVKYWNFENEPKRSYDPLADPLDLLTVAYTGLGSHSGTFAVSIPAQDAQQASSPSLYELRYYVQASSLAAAKASYPTATEVVQVVQAEQGWWLVRAKVAASTSRTIGSAGLSIDDVSVFPWRRNGAPASVSHFTYDRALGLVSSITGANGRTVRYKYDKLGRLMTVYDAYGNPSATTRYHHTAN